MTTPTADLRLIVAALQASRLSLAEIAGRTGLPLAVVERRLWTGGKRSLQPLFTQSGDGLYSLTEKGRAW